MRDVLVHGFIEIDQNKKTLKEVNKLLESKFGLSKEDEKWHLNTDKDGFIIDFPIRYRLQSSGTGYFKISFSAYCCDPDCKNRDFVSNLEKEISEIDGVQFSIIEFYEEWEEAVNYDRNDRE